MGHTITEKILAHTSHITEVYPGDYIVVDVDYVMFHDSTGPLAIKGFREVKEKVFNPKKVVVVFDHFFPAPSVDAARLHKFSRDFVFEQEITNFRCDGVCHQLLVENYVKPGDVVVGADSHTCTMGALGAFSTGMGSTDIAGILATGKTWLRVPESLKLNITGTPASGVYAKDVILKVASTLRADGALYKAIEFNGNYIKNATVSQRLTLSNMAVELGAKNGIIEADMKTQEYIGRKGQLFNSDSNAEYEETFEFEIDNLEPMIACPPVVDNIKKVADIEGTRIDQALIGTCTNGRLEDIAEAASILKGRKIAKHVRLLVIPASVKILKEAQKLGYIDIIHSSGGVIMNPNCGPCVGRHAGVLDEGEVCISTQNRNFTGRMGHPKSLIYLASPATVAASALQGEIVNPRKYL
ncbi:3-isopropylmalate dehydratase large subunit [Thermoproteota archaeon]